MHFSIQLAICFMYISKWSRHPLYLESHFSAQNRYRSERSPSAATTSMSVISTIIIAASLFVPHPSIYIYIYIYSSLLLFWIFLSFGFNAKRVHKLLAPLYIMRELLDVQFQTEKSSILKLIYFISLKKRHWLINLN